MDMSSPPDQANRQRIALLVQAELESRRIAISRELATIPPPVPACDVDFNRLLEDRGRIADELQQLSRLLNGDGGVETIREFCRESACLSDGLKQQIELLCAEATRH